VRVAFYGLYRFGPLITSTFQVYFQIFCGVRGFPVPHGVASLTSGTIIVLGAGGTEVQLHLVLGQHPEVPCLDTPVSGLLRCGGLIWTDSLG